MSSRWSAWETLRDHVASQEGPVWGYRGMGTLLGTEKPGNPLLSPSCAARPDVRLPGARQSWESSHLKSERTSPRADSNSSSRTTAEGPASTWGRALGAGAGGGRWGHGDGGGDDLHRWRRGCSSILAVMERAGGESETGRTASEERAPRAAHHLSAPSRGVPRSSPHGTVAEGLWREL